MFVQIPGETTFRVLFYCMGGFIKKKKKEASEIEKVQRSATKMVKNIRDLSYSERLRKLGLPTLEYKRRRADMIETFKIIHGIDKVDKNDMNIKSSKKTVGLNILTENCGNME